MRMYFHLCICFISDDETEDHADGVPDDRRPQTVIDESRLMVGTNPFLNVSVTPSQSLLVSNWSENSSQMLIRTNLPKMSSS